MLSPVNTVAIFKAQPEQFFKAREVIFQDGEPGHVMFGILAGEVEMQINAQVVEIIIAGDVFGQGALLHDDHLRASTAIAKTDCLLACLNRDRFLFAIQQTPLFALQVMRSYSDRFRRFKRSL